MNQSNSGNKTLVIVLAVLLALSLALVGYFWNQSIKLSASNESLMEEAAVMVELRNELISDIESLQKDYDNILATNDTLQKQFEATTLLLASKRAEVEKIKKSSTNIKAELEQLRTVKKELAAVVDQLKIENQKLKETNQMLTSLLTTSETENEELELEIMAIQQTNVKLEKDNLKMMAVSTRATDIRVDLRKRDDKPTGSAQRVREVIVSFDVKYLPANKTGDHNVYVVIKDANGMPVAVANPIKATIKPDTGGPSEEIIAQQMLSVNLQEAGRLQFKINPDKKDLKEGYYRVSIYTDWGLLGGAQFQLR